MTWSRFDDAARKHPKATSAGNEAWAFWCAAIMYCNQYGTDGFVPDSALATELLPVPITKAKAKALAERLRSCSVVPGQPALFIRDDARGGYVVHDFLDWNPSKAEVDAKRRSDRERKRTGNPDRIRMDSARNPSGVQTDSDPDSERSRVSARTPAPAARPPVPPAQPTRVEEEPPPPPVLTRDEQRVTICPLNLVSLAKERGVLAQLAEKLQVDVRSVEAKANEFVSYWTIGGGAGKERPLWMSKLREEIREAALANKLPAPGALDHAERQRIEADDKVLRLVREGALREQRERESSGGVVLTPAPAHVPRRRVEERGEQVALANQALASLRGAQRKDGMS